MRQKLYPHLRQLFFGFGRMVVAASDEQTEGALGEFGQSRELVSLGRSYRQKQILTFGQQTLTCTLNP
jgi:hypothetical protein